MRMPLWIFGWSKKEKIIFLIIIMSFLIFILGWIDVTFGDSREVEGQVISIGIDSSASMDLPRIILSVSVNKNEVTIIRLPVGSNIKKGDSIRMIEKEMYLSNGSTYSYAGY